MIRAVVVFGENIFKDADSYVVHPRNTASVAGNANARYNPL